MSPELPSPRPLEPDAPVSPSVVVLPAVSFDPPLDELGPWLDRLAIADALAVPGADASVYLTESGEVALTTSGMGKAPAATTVAALNTTPGLDLADSYWLSAGIAGAQPSTPLGSVVVADAVLDWDRKHRWDPAELPADDRDDRSEPAVQRLNYLPEGSIHRLAPALVERAVAAAESVDLADSETVREYAGRYTQDDGAGTPSVRVGPTVTSDEFWHGTAVAREVAAYAREYDLETYATTQMEDAATAAALDRFDALDRYLSVRAVANYDRPPAGETVHDSFEGTPESVEQAAENAARVGEAVVEALVDQE